MKKIKKLIAVLMAVISFACSMSVLAEAAESYDDLVAPCYNNTSSITVNLSINSSGKATAVVRCTGIQGTTTKIVAASKIQKKFGLIWINVTGTNWTVTAHKYSMSDTRTFQLDDTGTYRVKTTFTVTGSGGADDVIEKTSQATY